jgi:transaldolase
MEIWLDTVDKEVIRSANEMGIIHGITTNPSLIAKSPTQLEDLLIQLLDIQKGPVTSQVTANEATQMIKQGEALYRFSNRLIVKVPVTKEGLKAIHQLNLQDIPVMATAVFDTQQVLLAAKAGATYIAPYFSAICESDMSGMALCKAMVVLLERYRYSAKLLAASLKSAEHVRECIHLGVHAVTLNQEVFLSFIEDHPETLKRLDRFSKDWESAQKRKSLPL